MYLNEVFLEIKDRVGNLLENTRAGTGGWKEVAHVFGIEDDKIDILEGEQERGRCVIDFLTVTRPLLTVYDFCKYLKVIKRNDIITVLSDHFISGSN